ncbi:MAG: twin-arginine translocase subunit TatC [Chloroflexi bacterium]|nr:twin-arginine translocase subunit TatC [Chloroflexota bacterium]
MSNTAKTTKASGGAMPISGHFGEMRSRIFKAVIGVVVGTIIAFIFYDPYVTNFLMWPKPDAVNLQAIEVLETLTVMFTVSLTCGIIIAMPYIIYQLFAFIKPALTDKEKRYIYMAVPAIAGLFLLGVAFTYFIALPPALNFLMGFNPESVLVAPQYKNYVSIVTRVLLIMGVCFELPLLFMALATFGVIKKGFLGKWLKIWIIIAFILAAIITPTMDPINQSIIAGALIVLYLASIWLVDLAAGARERRLKKEAAAELAYVRAHPEDD